MQWSAVVAFGCRELVLSALWDLTRSREVLLLDVWCEPLQEEAIRRGVPAGTLSLLSSGWVTRVGEWMGV